MTFRMAVPFAAAVLAGASAAQAGSFGVAGEAGYFSLSAKDSARAVFDGSTGGGTFGGTARYVIRKGFYVEAGARTFSKKGERVFLASATGPIAKLGFPLEIHLTPIFGTFGFRFRNTHAFVPYLGVGAGTVKYKEKSDVAGDVQEDSTSHGSFHALVGVEYGTGLLHVGAEGIYSSVSDAIGLGGVSKVYGEKDLGGFTVLGKVILTFGK